MVTLQDYMRGRVELRDIKLDFLHEYKLIYLVLGWCLCVCVCVCVCVCMRVNGRILREPWGLVHHHITTQQSTQQIQV